MKKLFKLYLAVIMLRIYGSQVRKYTPTLNYIDVLAMFFFFPFFIIVKICCEIIKV